MTAPTIAVTCVANDQNGNPVAGAVFTARLDSTEVYQGFVVPERVQVVANASGIAVLNLWPNALGVAGSLYRVTAVNPDTGRKFLDTTISVPNSPCNLHEILVQAPYPPLDAAAQALMAAQGALALVTAQADIAAAKAVLTAADVVLTHADVVATGADADATAADRIQTGLDRVDTGEDVALTHADVLTTAGHAAATAADVLTLAPINAAMTELLAVQANLANINAVENNLTQIGAVATDVLKVNTVANNITSVNTVSGAMTNVNTTANNIGSVNAVAGSVGNVNIVATANANVSTVAGNIANVNTVAGVAPQVTTVAGNTINIDTVAGVSANVTTVAGSMASVNTVAGSIASVNSAATNMGAILTAPAQASAAASSSAAALASEIATAASATTASAASAAAQNAASVAAGHAASASSVVQQDLSGVNAAALHRSPNAVTAMCVYDTGKDSDGGAWTEKCQHTSWYNEAINGKWLGAQATEAAARAVSGATTSDYFQLTTDGKFYRLWKNLLQRSNEFDNAYWTKQGATVVANTVATIDPLGGNTAEKLVESVGGSEHRIYSPQIGSGTTAMVWTTYAKAAERAWVSLRSDTGTRVANFNVSSGVVGTTGGAGVTSSIESVGNGWYRCVMRASATNANERITINIGDADTGVSNGYSYVGDGTSGIYVWGAQVELGTVATAYEAKTTDGPTSETFRGNKRDFPRLSAIVAEAGNVTVYDLTEPGRPMWRRVTAASCVGVVALNGWVVTAQANTPAINYASDRTFTLGGAGTINAVAITSLPNSPVDQFSGLRVPTVAMARSTGLSVFNSGTLVSSSSTLAFNSIAIAPQLLAATRIADGTFYWAQNPGTLGASFALSTRTNTQAPGFGIGNTNGLIGPVRTEFVRRSNTAGLVQKLRNHESDPSRALVATIANTYNTGHQTGDIRRCFLSDTEVGSVTGAELVSNGGFDTDSGWTKGGPGVSWSSGRYTIADVAGSDSAINQQIVGTKAGRTYRLTLNIVTNTTTFGTAGFRALLGNSAGATVPVVSWLDALTGTVTLDIPCQFDNAWLVLHVSATDRQVVIESASLSELVVDRSFRAKNASINGTLTRAQLASSTSLVGYSGWSAANYLQEPYSADLDFGVGEWSVGAWVNTPTGNVAAATVAAREGATGAYIRLGIDATNKLTATAFDGTTTRTATTTAAYNTATWLKARVNYTTDGTLAILVNGVQVAATRGNPLLNLNSRYNLFSYSQEFDNAAWGKSNVTITANAATAPDGAVTADRLITNSGSNSLWYLQQIPSGLVGSLSYSIYAKADSATHIGFDTSNSGPMAGVNLSTGAISLNGLGISVSAQADGWYRITLNTTGDRLRVFCSTTEITSGNQAVTGDGVSGVLIWGAQVTPSALAALPYQRVNAATDFDFAAPLTIGNSFALDAPFPGSIALLKLSATVPTAEQAVWMYEQEKHLFQAGAQCCLPDAGAIADLTYDEATDKWIAISATNESEWSGLVRTSVTAVPAGSYTRAVAGGGVQLLARSTTTPGVDVTIPAYGLREELVKRAEAAARLNAQTALYDFVGGFTATTTSGSTSITSAASLTYPVSYVGARVTGSGIPADTFVAAVVGTTVYLTKAATASASAVQISFTDFILPVGYEAKVVLAGGANKVEGATKDFTRLFDGFKETIRFGTAPGHTAAIQIQATRSAA